MGQGWFRDRQKVYAPGNHGTSDHDGGMTENKKRSATAAPAQINKRTTNEQRNCSDGATTDYKYNHSEKTKIIPKIMVIKLRGFIFSPPGRVGLHLLLLWTEV